ncbi:uncharacterized protein LOC116246464 isoform X1 [Nymphaea colorata]|nr:uncharacterized protein LOC116246464 isoform X1 [Nymphaea colorata]
MSRTAIHGYQLEITVVGCWDLRDSSTKFHDQDPYVRLEYANIAVRTQVCKRKAKEPTFNQKFTFVLSEGCHDIGVAVWNKNTMERDYLICTTRVPLATVLCNGFDEAWWPLQYENRPAGQIHLLMNKLAVQRNNGMGYTLPVPAELHSSREAAVPYMAYPPPSFPITSQPLPSIPQPVLLPSTESRSVSFITAQPVPPPPQNTVLVSPRKASIDSIPFNPSAPSAPEESFSYDPPPPPPPIVVPSSFSLPSTDLQNHSAPVSPPSQIPPGYLEDRVANRKVDAVGEDRSQWTEVETLNPSTNQPVVQTTLPQISATSLRQRNSKRTRTSEERYSAAETTKSPSKPSSSLGGKARLRIFVFCLLLTLYLKVGFQFPNLSWLGS